MIKSIIMLSLPLIIDIIYLKWSKAVPCISHEVKPPLGGAVEGAPGATHYRHGLSVGGGHADSGTRVVHFASVVFR